MDAVKAMINKDVRKGLSRAKLMSTVGMGGAGDSENKEKKEKKKEKTKEKRKRVKTVVVPLPVQKKEKKEKKEKKPKRIRTKEEVEQDLLQWVKQQTDYVPMKLPQMTPEQAQSIALFRVITEAEERRVEERRKAQ